MTQKSYGLFGRVRSHYLQPNSKNCHYLFSVGAGEALFGGAADYQKSFGLLAVAIEATELSQILITDLAAQVVAGEASAIALLEGWVNRLNQTFSTEGTAINSRYFSLRMPENPAQLPSILADLHIDFFDYLNSFQQQQTEAAFRQFQEREQLNRQVVDSALSQLAAVLQPQQETEFFQQSTPLLVAAATHAAGMSCLPFHWPFWR